MYKKSKTKQKHNKILMVANQSFTYRCARSSGNTEKVLEQYMYEIDM